MAEVKIKPGSLTIEVDDGGKIVTLDCPWMSPLTKVVLHPRGKPEEVIWAPKTATVP